MSNPKKQSSAPKTYPQAIIVNHKYIIQKKTFTIHS